MWSYGERNSARERAVVGVAEPGYCLLLGMIFPVQGSSHLPFNQVPVFKPGGTDLSGFERFERAIYSTAQKGDKTRACYFARHDHQFEELKSFGLP